MYLQTNAMFVCLPDHSLLEVSNEVLALLLIQILTTIGLLWGEKNLAFFPLKKKNTMKIVDCLLIFMFNIYEFLQFIQDIEFIY